MKKKQLLIIGICAALLALLIAAALILPSLLSDQAKEGQKNISFTVVYEDGKRETFNISTDKKYLADALFDEGLVTEAEYKAGFYTQINGIEAVWAEDSAWWCITKGGEMTSGMNETVIEDGDSFEATYTKG